MIYYEQHSFQLFFPEELNQINYGHTFLKINFILLGYLQHKVYKTLAVH